MEIKSRIIVYLQSTYTKDGKCAQKAQIRIRVKFGKDSFALNIGYSVTHSAWDSKKGRVKTGYRDKVGNNYTSINKRIDEYCAKANAILSSLNLDDEAPSISDIRSRFLKGIGREEKRKTSQVTTLFQAFLSYINDKTVSKTEKTWKDSTTEKRMSFARIINDFDGDSTLSDFNSKKFEEFHKYMLGRGLVNETIKRDIRQMRSFLYWCKQNNIIKSDDWQKYRPKVRTICGTPQVVFLTWNELMKLHDTEFPSNKEYLAKVRDVFLFQSFTSLRYSDVAKLKKSDIYDGIIHVVTQKTDIAIEIELNKYSKEILERYQDEDFPNGLALPIISNQKMNDYLKEMCCVAGIDTPIKKLYYKGNDLLEIDKPKYEFIGTHTARRSFICNALEMGIDAQTVMKWTGHSDYKSMQPYISVSNEHKHACMSLFNK